MAIVNRQTAGRPTGEATAKGPGRRESSDKGLSCSSTASEDMAVHFEDSQQGRLTNGCKEGVRERKRSRGHCAVAWRLEQKCV